MKIIIGGDIVPINSNLSLFKDEAKSLFGDLQTHFDEADLTIVNLEVPLTNSENPILKSGANLKADVNAASKLKSSGINLVSLANNHMGDFGDQGILDTLEHCRKAKIQTVGAGINLDEAKKYRLIETNGKKVVIISCSDTEFGIAEKDTPGANPFDLKSLTLQILELKKEVDFLIVILHEGKEHYAYPSPELQDSCRFICDLGADLVVCQHSHISGARETYKNAEIIYGQGNLLFDYANRRSETWIQGHLIAVELKNSKFITNLIPFQQTFPGIKSLSEEEEKVFHEKMTIMSENVLDREFIERNWGEFITRFEKTYYSTFRGHGKLQRKLFSYFPFVNSLYSPKKNAILLNVLRSRVHREAIIDLLEKKIKR